MHEVLDRIVEFVSHRLSCDSCFIYVLEGSDLVLRASKNPHPASFAELPKDHYQALLSIPVVSRGRVVSVINVQHQEPHTFPPGDVKLISMIGHLVGAAIEMARLENEVMELSGKLAVRKIIERAKGIVQSEFGISEEEADSLIKKQARSRRKSMKEIAEAILVTNDIKLNQRRPPPVDELAS